MEKREKKLEEEKREMEKKLQQEEEKRKQFEREREEEIKKSEKARQALLAGTDNDNFTFYDTHLSYSMT